MAGCALHQFTDPKLNKAGAVALKIVPLDGKGRFPVLVRDAQGLLGETLGLNRSAEENLANAILISAAPELLTALEKLLIALNGPMNEITKAKDEAIFAYLKARGEK